MMTLHYLEVTKPDGGQFISFATLNKTTADMHLRRSREAAKDESQPEYKSQFHLREVFVAVDILDLWRQIKLHPAYAFGALFTATDFGIRGMPSNFDMAGAEDQIVTLGHDLIDEAWEEENREERFHRFRLRSPLSWRRKSNANRCPVQQNHQE
jgi:hypothetical protein